MKSRNGQIHIVDAYENNLKHISLQITKNKLTVFTGVSGSGKSSLVFDTIAVESVRQMQEIFPLYLRSRMPHYERPKVEEIRGLAAAIVIDQKAFSGDMRSTVGTMTDAAPLLRLLFSRCAQPRCKSSAMYSFNDPAGMCPTCSGLGKTVQFDLEKLVDRTKSLNQGAILFPGHQVGTYQWMLYANCGLLDPDKPLAQYTEKEWFDFLHGSGVVVEISNAKGKVWDSYNLTYEGFLDRITRLYLRRNTATLSKSKKKVIEAFTNEQVCPCCNGTRLNEEVLQSRLCGYNIAEMGELEMQDLYQLLTTITDPNGIGIIRKLQQILQNITEIGLGYLNLNRQTPTLSGGEVQRLKIVRHLESSLVGLTYILDEPSTGLHPRDVAKLNELLLHLRDRDNTVLVVEHDKDVIRMADEVVDLGPQAGQNGGQVLFQGTVENLLRSDTLTACNLCKHISVNLAPMQAQGYLEISHASLHNLKDVSVRIPRGILTAVSGVAGSGKSTLVCDVLQQQYPEVIHISQSPIGTTPRSTPATYIGIMDDIRKLFAKENAVSASLFSSNSEGACPVCGGKGVVKTEMAFMEPITVPCESCRGNKYNSTVLQYKLRGKHILQVLAMTVDEALVFFHEPKIASKLKALQHVGMGYMTLGQPTDTLSGGECQRVKLASCLQEKNQIYVMDEPTTGLHSADVDLLVKLLRQLVEHGSTVIVVEHDLDVIRQADWVIDMGPEGGKNGGRILFEGTPEALLRCGSSATAVYLQKELQRNGGTKNE